MMKEDFLLRKEDDLNKYIRSFTILKKKTFFIFKKTVVFLLYSSFQFNVAFVKTKLNLCDMYGKFIFS